MAGKVEARLRELNIDVPEALSPAGNYVPFVITGSLVFVSGQLPKLGDEMITGKVGADLEIEAGQRAARYCGLNLIAQLKNACGGDLDRVRRVVKLGGFVNAPLDFEASPQVLNGASDLMVEVFGDAGRHARFAVGAGSLPLGIAVEVDGVFEIE